MLWVPQKGQVLVEHNTGSVGANIGTSVTTGASAGTKGTPAVLIASTAFDAYSVRIVAQSYGANSTSSEGALDIMVGAATEEVIIPNLLMGYCGSIDAAGHGPKMWEFPLYIPAGTRLTAQACGARTSTAFRVAVWLIGGNGSPPFRVGSKVTTYGIGALPAATAVTQGASGAEGAWTQITASTSEDHFAVLPSMQFTTLGTAGALRNFALDIGVGAAAAEEMIAEGYWFGLDANEQLNGAYPAFPTFQDIPSGTRLSARLSSSGTVASQNPEVALHCMS